VNWVKVADLSSIPHDRGFLVDIGEDRIALFRLGDEVYAIGDRCSHAEASLAEGELFDTEVECPRHGSAFDIRTGKALTLPATKPVPVYEVKVEEGQVFISRAES
jgi:3-phenylpropionate/trans-cinnamate dioxygenase ferredoxin subunit